VRQRLNRCPYLGHGPAVDPLWVMLGEPFHQCPGGPGGADIDRIDALVRARAVGAVTAAGLAGTDALVVAGALRLEQALARLSAPAAPPASVDEAGPPPRPPSV